MANAKISDDAVFVPETSDIRNITGLAGFTGSANTKITGAFLAQSVVNESGSGIGTNDGNGNINSRVAYYGVGNPSNTLAGSEGFQYYSANSTNSTPASLQLGVAGGFAIDVGNLILKGNYIAGNSQPELNFKFGDQTNNPKTFKVTTQSDGSDQIWLLPKALPTAGQVLEASALSLNTVTLQWSTPTFSTPGLGAVLTADNESVDGQILKMTDAGEYLEIYANSIKHTTIANDFEIENELGALSLIAEGGIDMESDVSFGSNGIKDSTSSLGTNGQVLSSTGSALQWTTPTTSGGINFSGLNIATIKADLTQSSQTQYGQAVTVKASSAIDNGAVVIWDYSGTEVQAKMPSGATPDQHEIIGIAIEDIASGLTGKVLIYGYATAKFVPIAGNVVTNLALTTGTVNGGTTIVSDINNATTFTDANVGPNNSYASNSVLSHTFYNNEGTISMKFVDWNIEQAASSIYDRLGFTVSNDGTNFANATFTPATDGETGGFRQSSTPVAPWATGEDTGNPDGYILCESPGGAFPANSTINTGFKYVRVYFSSDSITQPSPGWEIEVYGTNGVGSSSVAINEGVFINPNDLSATSGLANTGRTLGNYISTDVTNNAVVMFVAPARPQQ